MDKWIIYAVPQDLATPVHIWTPDGETLKCQGVAIDGPCTIVSTSRDEPLLTPEGKYLVVWVETMSAMHMEGLNDSA
jgi:hypothetical protein